MQYSYVAYPAMAHLLSKSRKLFVLDNGISIKWPHSKSDNEVIIRWDTESSARRMILKIYPNERPTDIRIFYSALTSLLSELKPLLYRLRIKNKTLFPTLNAITSYLDSLNDFCEIVLHKYTDELIKTIPSYKLMLLNKYLDIPIINLPPSQRINTILKILDSKIWELLKFLSKAYQGILFIDFYLPDALIEFEYDWLYEIGKIGESIYSKKIPLFLCYQSEETISHLSEVIKIINLTSSQAEIYRDILTMALLNKKKEFSITDLIKFKFSYYTYHEIFMILEQKLDFLSSSGLIRKINEENYELLSFEDFIKID